MITLVMISDGDGPIRSRSRKASRAGSRSGRYR